MKQIIKNLFQNKVHLAIALAFVTVVSLVFAMLSSGVSATFWRTDGFEEYSQSRDDPTGKIYGYGYGDEGWGYGYGYGYGAVEDFANAGYYVGQNAYENPENVESIGFGQANVQGGNPTNTTLVTMTNTVSFSPGGGIQAVLPQGLQVTQAGGGAFDATAIQANTGSSGTGDVGATFSINGQVDFGLGVGGTKLIFSLPVRIVVPVPGVENGTSVAIAVRHSGEGFTTGALSTDQNAVCDDNGNATPSASSAVVSGGTVTIYTCSASQFVTYSSSGAAAAAGTTSSAAGTGGGYGVFMAESDSNTETSSLVSSFLSIVNTLRTYARTIQIDDALINENSTTGAKTAKLTGSQGEIILKPNKNSTVWVVIPSNTLVTGTSDWDGRILPPLVRTDTVVSSFGETIRGTLKKLMRSDVDVVVKAGSMLSPLSFSNPVELVVPVDLPDGTSVQVLYSGDGEVWEKGGTVVVQKGKVSFSGTHFSYFAFSSSLTIETLRGVADKFQDISGHWAEDYIKTIANLGIVSGKTSARFAPNDQITRAELTKIALNAFNIDVPKEVVVAPFEDVSLTAWYTPYIKAAKDNGIVAGWGDGNFAPDVPVNRAAALKILLEAAEFDTSGAITVFFKDIVSGSWYMKYVNFAKNNGIISGYNDGSFRPAGNITRAEVAKITTKILDLQ